MSGLSGGVDVCRRYRRPGLSLQSPVPMNHVAEPFNHAPPYSLFFPPLPKRRPQKPYHLQ